MPDLKVTIILCEENHDNQEYAITSIRHKKFIYPVALYTNSCLIKTQHNPSHLHILITIIGPIGELPQPQGSKQKNVPPSSEESKSSTYQQQHPNPEAGISKT